MIVSETQVGASAKASAWEWAQVTLLGFNLVWTTLCLGGFLAETMVVTSALTGAVLTVHFMERTFGLRTASTSERGSLPRLHPAGWWLLPFLAYAAMNVAWVTPVPWLGWFDWYGWAQSAAFFWIVLNGVRSKAPRVALFISLVVLGAGLVALASYQRFVAPDWLMLGRTQAAQFLGRSSGSFGAPNSLAAFLLLILPVAGALTIRRGATATQRLLWGYVTAVFALGLVLTISRGAGLALGIVVAVCPLFVVRGPFASKAAYTLGSFLCLGLVAAVVYSSVPAVRERIGSLITQRGELSRPVMWNAAWNIFREAPALGGGAGSYGVRFDQHRPETFQLEARWAHNEYLNILSDYGLVGLGLVVGGWGAIAVGCARRRGAATGRWFESDAVTSGLGAGLAAFALHLALDFNLKIPSLAITFAIVAAMFVRSRWPGGILVGEKPIPLRHRVISAVAGLAVSSATVLIVMPHYRGEAKRQVARQTVDRMAAGRSEPDATVLWTAQANLLAATKLAPSNGRAWADLAYVTTALARFDLTRANELGREAEQAADQALNVSPVVADFWVQKGVALDMQGRWPDAGSALVKALELAPARAGVWYQQAIHLSLKPAHRVQARAAAEFALRLDPGNPEAHALRQRLAERSHAP